MVGGSMCSERVAPRPRDPQPSLLTTSLPAPPSLPPLSPWQMRPTTCGSRPPPPPPTWPSTRAAITGRRGWTSPPRGPTSTWPSRATPKTTAVRAVLREALMVMAAVLGRSCRGSCILSSPSPHPPSSRCSRSSAPSARAAPAPIAKHGTSYSAAFVGGAAAMFLAIVGKADQSSTVPPIDMITVRWLAGIGGGLRWASACQRMHEPRVNPPHCQAAADLPVLLWPPPPVCRRSRSSF